MEDKRLVGWLSSLKRSRTKNWGEKNLPGE